MRTTDCIFVPIAEFRIPHFEIRICQKSPDVDRYNRHKSALPKTEHEVIYIDKGFI